MIWVWTGNIDESNATVLPFPVVEYPFLLAWLCLGEDIRGVRLLDTSDMDAALDAAMLHAGSEDPSAASSRGGLAKGFEDRSKPTLL
ncbi:hypothetical protein PHLCEN_2v11362 [Hermanssonia centrifuga]|uniref:Uncharacterized protein n=1 Tax=Hermanssonia centrifuga TaxID=98765 RepID=A0A2R6NK78_9APHY|nr:hypothetical protein PHLCEN_2v11362 [Hermanssonia centrifuga]